MNRENPDGWSGGSKATTYWMVLKHSPWGIKLFHHKYSMHEISETGWHFNTMRGQDRSLYKWINTGPIYFEGLENALIELGENPDLLDQFDGLAIEHSHTKNIGQIFSYLELKTETTL